MAPATTWHPPLAAPSNARLFDSVPPLVNTTPAGGEPASAAMAASTENVVRRKKEAVPPPRPSQHMRRSPIREAIDGMDLATMRDRAKTRTRALAYGIFALGWRGSNRHWQHYETAYMILAALATPLVLSVHTVVSFDFATSQLPGWHTTIFPPYFVAGAIFLSLIHI